MEIGSCQLGSLEYTAKPRRLTALAGPYQANGTTRGHACQRHTSARYCMSRQPLTFFGSWIRWRALKDSAQMGCAESARRTSKDAGSSTWKTRCSGATGPSCRRSSTRPSHYFRISAGLSSSAPLNMLHALKCVRTGYVARPLSRLLAFDLPYLSPAFSG